MELDSETGNLATEPSYNIKATLAQIGAALLVSMSMSQMGMVLAMPTLVIGSFSANATLSDEQANDDSLKLTTEQLTWYGSLIYLSQPLGCILFGPLQDAFGRKIGMTIVNSVFILGWFSLYAAQSALALFASSTLLGFGVGLINVAPLYISEIVETRLRSVFGCIFGICTGISILVVFTLNLLFDWRDLAFYFAVYSAAAMSATFILMPESPIWLISRGKESEAKKSLRILRGYARNEIVAIELRSLCEYAEKPKNNKAGNVLANYKGKISATLRKFMAPENLDPFVTLNVLFTLCTISLAIPLKPYLFGILEQLKMPIGVDLSLVVINVSSLIGSIVFLFVVKIIGKRRQVLAFATISAFSFLALAAYAKGLIDEAPFAQWIALVLMCTICTISVYSAAYTYLGELFSVECRGLASGLTTAIHCLLAFYLTKTSYDLINAITLPGTFLLYGFVCLMIVPYMYFKLPDTEGKTLQQIRYSLANKKIADCK